MEVVGDIKKVVDEMIESIHCPICRGALHVPTFLLCGHIYCSHCIRTSVEVTRKCPACNYEGSLEPRPLHQFNMVCKQVARLGTLVVELEATLGKQNGHNLQTPVTAVVDVDAEDDVMEEEYDDDDEDFIPPGQMKKRAKVRPKRKKRVKVVNVNDDDDDDDLCISCICDICGLSVPLEKFDAHATACEKKPVQKPQKKKQKKESGRRNQNDFVDVVVDRSSMKVAKLYYKGLKLDKLRGACKKLGFNVFGLSFAALKMRHQKFCNLWNAFCDDATAPAKTKSEIAREVETEIRGTSTIYGKDRVENAVPLRDLVAQAKRSLPSSYKQSRKE